jgi:ABC-2 type transport system permease protein
MKRRQAREVALREIRTRGRSRGFRTITGLMLLLAIAAPIVVSFIPGPNDDLPEVTIGIGAGLPDGLEQAIAALGSDAYELSFRDVSENRIGDIDTMLTDGELDVAIEFPGQLVWAETESSALTSLISAAINQVAAIERANDMGLDVDELSELFTPTELSRRLVAASSNTESVRQGVAFFGLFLAFLLPQIFGQLTMLSVVEEKATRVVEVLLSHIRPSTLLSGKILGLCALAIVQLLLIVIGLIGSLLATEVVEVPASVWQFVPMLALCVIGGLAIYTTLFALLGSLISRQEDAAQVMMPVFAPLMVGYFVGQAAVFGNAETIWVKVLTWFPLTSPMILPVRVARDAIGPAEIAVSLALQALTVWMLIRLASRVYEFTLLRTGSRVGWGELLRLSRGTLLE